MSKTIKVPKEIQTVFTEAHACQILAMTYSRGWVPSPKAFYYAMKSAKFNTVAWQTLGSVFPDVLDGVWDVSAGMDLISKRQAPTETKEKKPRKPRVAKTPVAVVAVNQGVTK